MQGAGMDGLELLDLVKGIDPDLPVVMISGHGNIETAVSAIKRGAYDFLEKPFKSDRLLLVVERALEAARPEAREPAPAHASATPDGFVGALDRGPAAAPDDRQGRHRPTAGC
jgi:two-component system nitrogen regulation response regulator NtrX